MPIETLNTLANKAEKKDRLLQLRAEVAQYASVRENVFTQMLERGEHKYKWFLRGISILKHLADSEEQSGVIENFYVAMRYIDDIVDGDAKLPENYKNSSQYVEDKINFIETRRPPKDDIENLLALSFRMGAEFGADFRDETKDILNSLLFDSKRRGTHEIFGEQTLHDHFYVLDIKGTIGGALRVIGENPDLYKVLEPLGEADRIYYSLRDFREDIKVGFVNISAEDCARLGITKDMLILGTYANYPGIRIWFREQAEKGLVLINEYHKRRKGVSIRPVTRATLKLAFERKAKFFMTRVAKGDFKKIFES